MVSLLALIGAHTSIPFERHLGNDGEADTYADSVTLAGRVTPMSKQIQLPTGRVVTLAYQVTLPGGVDPNPGDRVTIDGARRRIEQVSTPVWLDGTAMHHHCGVS